jgi:hypothetical protein
MPRDGEGREGCVGVGIGKLLPVRDIAQVLAGLRLGVRLPKVAVSIRKSVLFSVSALVVRALQFAALRRLGFRLGRELQGQRYMLSRTMARNCAKHVLK